MNKLCLLLLFMPSLATAQCGNTLNWTNPTCQIIGGTQQLTTATVNGVSTSNAWSVVSRHGEYSQGETECNTPDAITVTGGNMVITTTAQATTCGNFKATDGTVWTAPASWPFKTGDVQWNTLNFKFGTVVIRQKVPAQNTNLWVGEWLLGSNCQAPNKYNGETGDTFSGTCPGLNVAGYDEIDILETKSNEAGWGNTWMVNNGHGQAGVCTFNQDPLDTNFHVYALNWTSTVVSETIDGVTTGCVYNNQSPLNNMFLILQIQTSTMTGTPVNLPGQLTIDYVKVCNGTLTSAQCVAAASNDANVIFFDDFLPTQTSTPAPAANLFAFIPRMEFDLQ